MADAEAQQHRRKNVTIVSGPVDLDLVLPQVDWVVNYGSTTFVCQAVLAGKPQLMLPTDAEKWLVARRVHAQGAGVAVTDRATIDEIGRSLARVGEGSVATQRMADNGNLPLSLRLSVEIDHCMETAN